MGQLPATQTSNALQAWGKREGVRAIFASGQHRQLLDNFQQTSQIPSSDGYHAQQLINAVNSLRAAASPLNSMLKPNQPTRRLLVAGYFEIEYELNSYYGDCQTDIEIVDIRFTGKKAEREHRPALWEISHNLNVYDSPWQPGETPQYKLQATPTQPGTKDSPIKVGINGHSGNLQKAANTLGNQISRGDSKKRLSLQKTGFLLAYVPSSSFLGDEWAALKSLGLNGTDEQRLASRIVAQHMYEAHQQGLHVEWTAHTHGCWVLTEAMQQLAHRSIDLQEKQKIFLCSSTASHVMADRARHALNMDTGDSNWHSTPLGTTQVSSAFHFGLAPLMSLADKARRCTDPQDKADQFAELAHESVKFLATSILAGATIATAGVPFSAAMLGVSTVIASLPGAKDEFYKNPAQQLLAWSRRFKKN